MQDFIWDAVIEPCEEILCQPPPITPANSIMGFRSGFDKENIRSYDTEVYYWCPKVQPSTAEQYYSFNFTSVRNSRIVRWFEIKCDSDGLWSVHKQSYLGEERYVKRKFYIT